jgi:hypothetical protein
LHIICANQIDYIWFLIETLKLTLNSRIFKDFVDHISIKSSRALLLFHALLFFTTCLANLRPSNSNTRVIRVSTTSSYPSKMMLLSKFILNGELRTLCWFLLSNDWTICRRYIDTLKLAIAKTWGLPWRLVLLYSIFFRSLKTCFHLI